ncbi:phosphoribosylglycinamide synthetase [Sphingomonas sp. LaA6.9]|uniref:phosphoribosylglycinamide synthetase n=1 Tax=Sphingomonas sp. LaA6.9 TaxID=2919914 RepID=UPI001F4F257A|nr:phosphoribosylglycinamide synthetase [Sphingomonas sp. LaA6.9]MCJ8158173.1 phosphoribosylglycinamide synthetase [Sphingomonas sp. LaA6.9]
MTQPIKPLRIPQEAKDRLKIMFIAKHALGDGTLHPEDGNHAVYHHEVRTILEGLGINLVLANKYEALFENPGVDFVFPLLNRGGFLNSEMMLPLLCTRLGIPYLGASPILRGLSDDKHLTKLEAKSRGIPTAPWAIYRRGAPVREADCPMAERMVIKPNASSASWGVGDAGDWAGVKAAVEGIHDQGHDAIVEPFLNGSDVEVPVITVNGEPVVMPMMMFRQADPTHLRTYWEKRDLVDRTQKYELFAFEDKEWAPKIDALTRKMVEVFRPFDYGRYEFRLDEEKGEVQMLEVNLNCNLWSQKVYGRSAVLAGLTQEQLIETILCESLARHGLIDRDAIA